jgi:hypothetical protein
MSDTDKFTYIMYLVEDSDIEKLIYLGSCNDPVKLYYNSTNVDLFDNEKPYLIKWLNLFEKNLDTQEKKDLEYAFMSNPETEFSYEIKNMRLVINKINQF